MCVCVLFLDLFQKSQSVQLDKSHTEESLGRHRSGRYCQVLSSHSGQVRKGFPFERGRSKSPSREDGSKSMDVTVVLTPKRSSKSLLPQ